MKGTRPPALVAYDDARDSRDEPATLQQEEEAPGSLLPADFPPVLRAELHPDHLAMLEEYYLAKRDETALRFYALLRVHPRTLELQPRDVMVNCAIVARLFRIGEEEETRPRTWPQIARACGVHPRVVMYHVAAIRSQLKAWARETASSPK